MDAYFRRYVVAPKYRPEERLRLRTADGVTLAGAHLRGPADAIASIVLVHGFANWSRTPKVLAFARQLSERFDVIVPDLRGHGQSGGRSTMGEHEPLDVDAAVDAAIAASPGRPVVTVGTSLGGAAVVLHAGAAGLRPVAGTVANSAPAWWAGPTGEGAARVARLVTSRAGRAAMRLTRTRLAPRRTAAVPDPVDVVANIAPGFVVVVHDPDDWYFPQAHADALYERADEPKELWLYPGDGHGIDLLTPALAERVTGAIEARLGD